MRLTPTQERLLLRIIWGQIYLAGDFGRAENFQGIQALLSLGFLAEDGKNLIVTQRGREYCDLHLLDISLCSSTLPR